MKAKIVLSLLIISVFICCCKKKEQIYDSSYFSGAPVLPKVPYDYKNSFNDAAATLGRVLFYDPKLSINNSVACASCHQQEKAFCDNLQFGKGFDNNLTKRNSPTIFARPGHLFWDGRANSLKDLTLMPVKNHLEMDFQNVAALAEKLSGISYYPDLFKQAFGSGDIDTIRIKSALAEFLSNFAFSGNKFNRSLTKTEELSAAESFGKTIFFGKGRCSKCHHIQDPDPGSGNGYGTTPTFVDNQANIGLDKVYADKGIGEISQSPDDYGKFMVPVLLNIEYTAPYMHDGRYTSLEDVVEHYNSGINDHSNLSFKLRDLGVNDTLSDDAKVKLLDLNKNGQVDASEAAPYPPVTLGLTVAEKEALVSFLKTLSDPSIYSNVMFSNPFKKK